MIKNAILVCFLVISLSTKILSQTSIGPADGDYITIESTEIVYLADAVHCGFNDLSAPNMGRFRREHLKIDSYRNGKLLGSRTDTRDVFLDCYQP
jgi:hypothetical protein